MSPSPTKQARITKLEELRRGQKQNEHGTSDDGSNSNLMWLLDFKLDFFNEGAAGQQQYQLQQQHLQQLQEQHQLQQQQASASAVHHVEEDAVAALVQGRVISVSIKATLMLLSAELARDKG